ncbi:MAG: helix-turn-helix domain-containing protein [Actinomycetia bacterium]|nr:helix-turn-helix domain-containing protein [Actinomycetes bacterium]
MSAVERAQADAFSAAAKLAADVLALRLTNDLTQNKLAELAGIAQADLSRIERGQANPTIATFERIARALNADVRMVPREAAPAA